MTGRKTTNNPKKNTFFILTPLLSVFMNFEKKKAPKREKFPLELSCGHLREIAAHYFPQKV